MANADESPFSPPTSNVLLSRSVGIDAQPVKPRSTVFSDSDASLRSESSNEITCSLPSRVTKYMVLPSCDTTILEFVVTPRESSPNTSPVF